MHHTSRVLLACCLLLTTVGVEENPPITPLEPAAETPLSTDEPPRIVGGRSQSETLNQARLIAPLTTLIPGQGLLPPHSRAIQVRIGIPPEAPDDLGIGCYLQDDTGRWFHRIYHQPLDEPGVYSFTFLVDGLQRLQAEPGGPVWSALQRRRASRYGIFLWSGQRSDALIDVFHLMPAAQAPPARQAQARSLAIHEFDGDQPTGTGWAATTGERWELRCRPEPLPANAYDREAIALDLVATRPDGSRITVGGFYRQPMALTDRGDAEAHRPTGPGEMAFRLRPGQPGTWRLRLEARWGEDRIAQDLPALQVSGPAWDAYVRVDPQDPRFFSVGSADDRRFHWPVGLNLRSITDSRSRRSELATDPTPNRGFYSYAAYLDRLGRAGCQLVEIWLSDWNMGLEGMPSTAGYHGVGHYNEAHAERLDRVLDRAWAKGIRVLLVINHHGQASTRVDAEWNLNPYNAANGGPLRTSRELFTSDEAERYQERMRRYLIARYGDHPAIFAWKLWTEIDLTDQGWVTRHQRTPNHVLIDWHRQAAASWQELDPYDHPVTTHWSTNYTYVESGIAELDAIDFIGIDAYHGLSRNDFPLHELLSASIHNRARGLERYGKPILVTEFGGHPTAGPPDQILAEHRYAPWVALMSGHGGAPLLWWYEWVDQNEHFLPFQALPRFLAGE
ncbi:MAG: hypothetical protein ACOCXJ_03465, partial [Planctomycetota bacterium]